MTFTLADVIASADRVAEARKRSHARVKGQETRHALSAVTTLRNYDAERRQYPVRTPDAEQRRLDGLRKACADGRQLSSFTQIRMVISEWYHDEFGNLTRTIRAAE